MLYFTSVLAMAVVAATAAHAADDPTHTDGDKYKVVFENEKVRVLEYKDLPGEKTHQHRHPDFVLGKHATTSQRAHHRGLSRKSKRCCAKGAVQAAASSPVSPEPSSMPNSLSLR